MSYRIPFNKATLLGREHAHIDEAFRAGHISGDGPFTQRCRELLERRLGLRRLMLTPSCTHALEMAAILLDLRPGDEVIAPSFGFVTTINAFVLHGATPVFADIRPDTLNLDERALQGLITPRTRAIVPIHYAGVAAEMDAINALAEPRGITVVEDNAHGLFGMYRGRPLGSLARMSTYSFHETKNFTCGEGGALALTREADVARAEIIREKGTDRSRFFRGEVDKYTWVDVGSSYLLSDILAAMLWTQLEAADEIQVRRRAIWLRYRESLADWAAARGVALPCVPEHCEPAWHLFHMICPDQTFRAGLIAHLKARGILSVFHYIPLHTSAMGRRYGGREGQCPVTEDLSERLLRLPFYNALEPAQQDAVIAAVRQYG